MAITPRSIRPWLGLAVVLSAHGAWAAGSADESDQGGTISVNVVVDMTEAGKKIARPTPDKPVYYLPMPEGYKEIGFAPYFQRPPPPPLEVEHFIEREFAKQGYRVLVKGSHPSLVLDMQWGYIDPQGGRIPPGWMNGILLGHLGANGAWDEHTALHDGNPMDHRTADDLKQMGRFGVYYVVVSAMDFQDWLHHKVTLEWRAHISGGLWGHYFDQVLPLMVTTAAPLLGRESTRPQLTEVPFVPPGHVIVGAPYTKSDAPAAGAKAGP